MIVSAVYHALQRNCVEVLEGASACGEQFSYLTKFCVIFKNCKALKYQFEANRVEVNLCF
jgi:hypothetical protein